MQIFLILKTPFHRQHVRSPPATNSSPSLTSIEWACLWAPPPVTSIHHERRKLASSDKGIALIPGWMEMFVKQPCGKVCAQSRHKLFVVNDSICACDASGGRPPSIVAARMQIGGIWSRMLLFSHTYDPLNFPNDRGQWGLPEIGQRFFHSCIHVLTSHLHLKTPIMVPPLSRLVLQVLSGVDYNLKEEFKMCKLDHGKAKGKNNPSFGRCCQPLQVPMYCSRLFGYELIRLSCLIGRSRSAQFRSRSSVHKNSFQLREKFSQFWWSRQFVPFNHNNTMEMKMFDEKRQLCEPSFMSYRRQRHQGPEISMGHPSSNGRNRTSHLHMRVHYAQFLLISRLLLMNLMFFGASLLPVRLGLHAKWPMVVK